VTPHAERLRQRTSPLHGHDHHRTKPNHDRAACAPLLVMPTSPFSTMIARAAVAGELPRRMKWVSWDASVAGLAGGQRLTI
jgi:hypothetical protein